MKSIILGFIALTMTMIFPIYGAILAVDAVGPADFASIQAAIDASWHGDTILVYPGLYPEDLYYNSRAITVTSLDPADPDIVAATVINGAVSFDFNEGPDSILTGLTLAGTSGIDFSSNHRNIDYCFISGNIVIFVVQDLHDGKIIKNIYGFDLTTKTEFPICAAPAPLDQSYPQISGNTIIWQDFRDGNWDIYGFDLTTKTEFPICTARNDQCEPQISGNTIVWTDSRDGYYDDYGGIWWDNDIYGFDLITKTEFPICTTPGDRWNPQISSNTIIWLDDRNGNYDIYGFDLITKAEFPICIAPRERQNPQISGNTIIWEDFRDGNWDIYGFDLTTKTEFPICTNPEFQCYPKINGNTIVWHDFRNGNLDIYGFDLTTKTEFPICTAPYDQYYPKISGNIIIWLDCRHGNSDIYGFDLKSKKEFPIVISYDIPISTRNATHAIVCSFSAPSILNNNILGFNDSAIVCEYDASPLIQNNTITKNAFGIMGGKGRIINNTIGNNQGPGLDTIAGIVSDNFIHNNKGSGIQNSTATIYRNTIQSNTGDGLYTCSGEIRENTIDSNSGAGISNCSGSILDNNIRLNAVGISATTARITGNTIQNNLAAGVSGGGDELRGNSILNNSGCGVASFAGLVTNNIIAGNRSDGVYSSTTLVNNTIVENLGHGVNLCSGVVKNNIIANNLGKGIYGPSANSYNCLWQNTAGSFFNNYAKTGDIYANPLFVQPGEWLGLDTPDTSDDAWTPGNYYLQSEYGFWNPLNNSWNHTPPGYNSPCIDAGDPADGILYEPNPNGGRINMGAYGGTAYASMSSTTGPEPGEEPKPKPVCISRPSADLNNDCLVNLADFAILAENWLACGFADPDDCPR